MIITDFEDIKRYYKMSRAFEICAEFAKNNDLVNYENGSYPVADGIKVNINDFECSDTPKYEGHRKMADIQLDLTGNEKCFVSNIKNGKTEVPYSEEKDVEWFSVAPEPLFAEILMNRETLVILFPEDIHSPTMYDGCKTVKKAIFKIDIKKYF